MIKLKDVYTIEGTKMDLGAFVLADSWFPEEDIDCLYQSEVLQKLIEDGRIEVRRLIYESTDGYRYAAMHTVWFDQKPVFIVQQAGRSGRDHFQRWVTDRPTYNELVAYLLSFCERRDIYDVADPEKLLYEEEVFYFYGNYFGNQFGIAQEPQRKVLILEYRTISLNQKPDLYAVFLPMADTKPLPAYIRRGGFVMEFLRELSREELDEENSRINLVNDETGYHRGHLYQKCEAAPEGTFVQPV